MDRYEQVDLAQPFNITLEISSGPVAVFDFSELIILIISKSGHSKVEGVTECDRDLLFGE